MGLRAHRGPLGLDAEGRPEYAATMARTADATIIDVVTHTAALSLAALQVAGLRPNALRPGAVASISVDHVGEAYFALASSPDDLPRAELLVRRGPPVAEALIEMHAGARVRLNGPVGRGFELTRLHGRSVACVGVGSAIGPLRSALLHMIAHRSRFGRIVLVYGARDAADIAFVEEHAAWTAAGVEVHITLSRPELTGWPGKAGRVQKHLEQVLGGMTDGGVLLCGMPAMIRETTGTLVTLGYRPESILMNY